ncbi:MAG: hypothetical protein QM780_17725 [Hyphomicrobium sp.]|uniref:hypothetical protein n=1 Tax=Hyphomicrobium sp. TaxID=82 RepID=UPI0039E66DB7
MFDLYEVSAAPHLPEPLKAKIPGRPETPFVRLAHAFEDDINIKVRMRESEIFIALTAS